ncbi:hypothetical protein DOTSEDRAFT_19416 [Dothistroma septosporum NZE10]|uniref:Glucose-methanol-choline oxidoreductase N-terminal domain-containing protein n=1 Tax=Dothistroma septosporum (strain NZE10 / CBS 128990) TaxID=675120 RepID=N1PZH0_DOTSN|nr:hypothetical protein DOTSEDRAFT_19416 [Dothistroma septosporum NZE10]
MAYLARLAAVFCTCVAIASSSSEHGHNTYDFIIVGGGTSGLVVANRLTENPDITVLVVEYGHLDNNASILVPFNANFNQFQNLYNLTSAPLTHMNNEPYPLMVAATVGGGSVVNGMFLDRASAADYDAWEELGNPGWGWEDLYPYFKKSTTLDRPTPEIAARYNYTYEVAAWGASGPVHASLPPWQWEELPYFLSGFRQLDRKIDFPLEGSDGSGVGVFWVPTSQKAATETRSDAKTAYYDPIAHRPNLHLAAATKVDKVLFEGKMAIGVEMTSRQHNVTLNARASKEVVLAAGGVFSANVLHLSGIGPSSMLKEAGIDVVHDLPGVGSNFQDHPTGYWQWNLTSDLTPNPETPFTNGTYNSIARKQYDTSKTGPYVQARGNNAAFLSLHTISDQAEEIIEMVSSQNASQYLPTTYDETSARGYAAQHKILLNRLQRTDSAMYEMPFKGAIGATNSLQKPLSRGTITLNGTDGSPIVNYNTLANPVDGILAIAMLNFTRQYYRTPALAPLGPSEFTPGAQYQSNEDILKVFKTVTGPGGLSPSFAHSSCSNPMMPLDLGGVVSPSLEVYGVERLSVVDSSIMPMIPATHLCGTVYAVAEKAADLIKARHACR